MNLDRQENLDLGTLIQQDATARVNWQRYPVVFIGVTDIAQSYHNVASALVNSENKHQLARLLQVVLKFANHIRERKGAEPYVLEWGLGDNCDAFQFAVRSVGGKNINCKVHESRNVKSAVLIVPTGQKRADIVKEIRDDLARMDNVTTYEGTSTCEPIGVKVQELFKDKWDKTQTQFAGTYEKEYMGPIKGNHQAGFMNPGLPVHSNAVESFNLGFKEDGGRAFGHTRFRKNPPLCVCLCL
jgi:hypothetical protein